MSSRKDATVVSRVSNRRVVIGVAAALVLVAGALWATRVLDPSNDPAPAAPSEASILRRGEVLELADDGMTLVATDTATREERPLARCTDCAYVREFASSASGRWIAYEALTCELACQPIPPGAGLWVVGAQGPKIHVTSSGSAWAWSPTTEQLAFVVGRMHGTEIVVLDPATGERTPIAGAGGAISAFAWSPDGSTIAYAANSFVGISAARPGANSESIEGSSIKAADATVEGLAWSPDGSRLAVSWHPSGVTVVRIDGSGKQTVLDRRPQHIAWSPDGRRLAFVDGHDVGVVSASGGAPLILTSAAGTPDFWSRLVWSPDGTLVAFTQGAGRPWYSVPSDVSGPSEHIDRLQVDRWIQGS